MTKVDAFYRFVLPCSTPAATTTSTTKKRLSRDDIEDPLRKIQENKGEGLTTAAAAATHFVAPQRPSKTVVIGTIFNHHRGHGRFYVQYDRLSTRPALSRFLLPCFPLARNTSSAAKTTTKKPLSTSLSDDIEDPFRKTHENRGQEECSITVDDRPLATHSVAPPRSSKTLVIDTMFGRGVSFCVPYNRLVIRPAFRRFLLPCFSPSAAANTTTSTTKKRPSASLCNDIEDPLRKTGERKGSAEDNPAAATRFLAPPRPSKTMVIDTIFGYLPGHAWFCVQHDRYNTRPVLLELPINTHLLINEMRRGFVRITLVCNDRLKPELSLCPLHSVPVWTMFRNGQKMGFAVRRKATDANRLMLKTMRTITVGSSVIPRGLESGTSGEGEFMFTRANFECVVGGPDLESFFHLVNPDECPNQGLGIFLLRSR